MSIGVVFDFAFMRFSRIYPAYVFWVFLSALMWMAVNAERVVDRQSIDEYLLSVGSHVVMTQSLIGAPIHFNIPMWSIAVEVIAYSTFPVVVMAFRWWGGLVVTTILLSVFLLASIHLTRVSIDQIEGGRRF